MIALKKIGKYDAMLSNSYSEVSAEMYVNTLSAIYLTSLEEPLADKEILKKIRLVSGVAESTLARVVKTIKR